MYRCQCSSIKHRTKIILLFSIIIITTIMTVVYKRTGFDGFKESMFGSERNIESLVKVQVDASPHVSFLVTRAHVNLLSYRDFVQNSSKVWNDVPVIVTAGSSNHYRESLLWIQNINKHLRPKFTNIKLIFFDIGLKPNEQRDLKVKCKCDFRPFPFDIFPPHVKRLKTFTWKPIIIALMLKEFDFVMWTDSSVRFDIRLPSRDLFQKARLMGIQLLNGGGSIAVRTVSATMDFLRVNHSAFIDIPEVQGGWGVYSRTKFTIDKVIRPWVLCALSPNCMYPGLNQPLFCDGESKTSLGFCHRSDQSVLGIIITQLFPKNRNQVTFEASTYGSLNKM